MSLISGNVTFGADAINCSSSSILGAAAFIDTASNQGTVSLALFSDTAVNEGTAVSAVFNDGAVNVGSLTSGTFLGTAVNSGVVTVAEFFGTASNLGVIVEAAKFADTSSNVGVVSGSAIFADTSVSNGVVEGAVQIAQTATQGENQALTETPTEYSQPNGFFPNGYYNGGSATYPPDYETVVYQVGSFWYKYDVLGAGSLANGNYSDGTSWFIFANGIKVAAGVPVYDSDGTFIRNETNYITIDGTQYANGTVDIVADGNGGERNGTFYYPSYGAITFISNYGTYYSTINNVQYANGTIDLVSNGSGGTTEFATTLPDGTVLFANYETIYITINGSQYENGTIDIVSSGGNTVWQTETSYGSLRQQFNYPSEFTELHNDGTYSYQADGIGGYNAVLL